MGSLVIRARTPHRKVWAADASSNTSVSVKSVGSKVLWADSRVQGTENMSLPFSFMPKLYSGDRRCRYLSSFEFRRANSYLLSLCMVLKTPSQPTQAYLLAPFRSRR
ncbi:hypothetical protein TNCV_2798571 [Trichonephila clavipes]|nr:hypothetical protein TNCV_2798571 [Trichonephila clavipes]